MQSIEKEIIEFIDRDYNPRKYFLFGPKCPVTRDTRIRDDLKLVFEDNEELLQAYFSRWRVEPGSSEILDYFHPGYLGSKEPDPHKPLTVAMLVESAKAGRWLYE
ncbi:DUF1493 family protein [Cronobacter malonaticus]|uniref:DUF1493 family protein n=1 Tax=Cronobacter malonaticus TaxID=413503 RepID=UPI0029CA821E|nr:DUF1493 family protein [Cronobacter malonaticus]